MNNAPLFFPAVQAASVLEPTETSGCCQDSCGLCFHGEWRHEGRLIRKDKRRTGSILDTERWWKTLHVDGKSTHVLKHFWIIFRSRKVSLKLLQWHLNILESIYHLFGEDTNNLIASSFWQLRKSALHVRELDSRFKSVLSAPKKDVMCIMMQVEHSYWSEQWKTGQVV